MARSSVAQLVLAESSCVSVLQVLLSAEPALEFIAVAGTICRRKVFRLAHVGFALMVRV